MKGIVSSTARRRDGVHVRVVSDQRPEEDVVANEPTLEDAYLYLISTTSGCADRKAAAGRDVRSLF